MNFLAPLFLLGTLAVALPVVFHLVRRSSKEKVDFSSLMFLSPTPPRVTRRSRIENLLLLLLRCLSIGLLAFGFSRPFIKKPIALEAPANQAARTVVLLDTSASMRQANVWADAVARVTQILQRAAPGDAVAVYTFDQRVQPLITFEEWTGMSADQRAASALDRVKGVQPSWYSTHLGKALLTASELIEENSKNDQFPGSRQIVVVSDLQEGSKLEGLQGYEWPRGIEVVIDSVSPGRPTNAGIQLVGAVDDSAYSDTAEEGYRVRVYNASSARREQFSLQWPGASTQPLSVQPYVPPGQSRVFKTPQVPEGSGIDRLILAGDDEPFDNTVYLVPQKPVELTILYAMSEPETDPAHSAYYLKRVFEGTRRRNIHLVPLNANQQTNAQAALLVATDLQADRFQAAMAFLEEGKTVIAVLNSTASGEAIGRLAGVDALPVEEVTPKDYAMFGQIDFEHPLFASFADPRFSDFTKIHFWKYRRISENNLPNAQVLARYETGDPVLLHIPVGKGSLFVLTSGWYPSDSQLALSSKFVPLLYSFVEWTGVLRQQASQFVVGEPVPLQGIQSQSPWRIRKPDGSEVDWQEAGLFTGTDTPGIYTVTSAQPPFRFAVNLAAEESRTAPMALNELERLKLPLKVDAVKSPRPEAEQARKETQIASELEHRQKLWRWLIFAALIIIVFETVLSAYASKSRMVPAS